MQRCIQSFPTLLNQPSQSSLPTDLMLFKLTVYNCNHFPKSVVGGGSIDWFRRRGHEQKPKSFTQFAIISVDGVEKASIFVPFKAQQPTHTINRTQRRRGRGRRSSAKPASRLAAWLCMSFSVEMSHACLWAKVFYIRLEIDFHSCVFNGLSDLIRCGNVVPDSRPPVLRSCSAVG